MSTSATHGKYWERNMMLTHLLNLLKKMFPADTAQTELERFLISKNIKTAVDIEHWQRQYETNQTNQRF